MPKISILIPVYNAEKYLRECLDSISAQTLADFEVICCNDGSTDSSLDILQEYADKDSRFKLLSKKNEGSSATRNVCLAQAQGEYLYFVDNDDLIAPDTLKDLYGAAIADNLDVVYANPNWIAERPDMKDPYANVKDPTNSEMKIQRGCELFVSMVNNGNYYAAPWRRFIKKVYADSIGLTFNGQASPNEDNLFSFYTDINAERVKFLPKRYYIHRSHDGSTMTQLSKNVNMGRIVVSHMICAFEIMKYSSEQSWEEPIRQAVQKRVNTLSNGALRFFGESGLEQKELDWRGRWIEENLFAFCLTISKKANQGVNGGIAIPVSPLKKLKTISPEQGDETNLKWKIKSYLKEILPMPFSKTKSEIQQITDLYRGKSTREYTALMQQFESLQKHMNLMQKNMADLTPTDSTGKTDSQAWKYAVIEKIELFFIKVDVERNFSHGSWKWRYQCMIRVSGGGFDGWSELTIPNPEHIHQILSDYSRKYYGNTIAGGLELCRCLRGTASDSILESFEMALLDLGAKVAGKTAIEFLGLEPFEKIPYLECVLQKDPKKAAEYAGMLSRGYLKIKLFGEIKLDCAIVAAVRKAIPANCYLTADVNLGYLFSERDRKIPTEEKLKKLTVWMTQLQEAGLNACEDPAPLSFAEMKDLQKRLKDMPIIPDALMRPAYKLCKSLDVVADHIYNLHPHCMGSVKAALKLASIIQQGHGKIMIGDNSLIGVGCIQWQMIAGGCGALWCEAVEKKLEKSDDFAKCLLASPMTKSDDGFCVYRANGLNGFGISIDIDKLKSISTNYIDISADTEI
ncbi:MAG: glycosyltransferase [Victivallales bacterium]|nr:glycosyltransferase [Victivallales bacterium]